MEILLSFPIWLTCGRRKKEKHFSAACKAEIAYQMTNLNFESYRRSSNLAADDVHEDVVKGFCFCFEHQWCGIDAYVQRFMFQHFIGYKLLVTFLTSGTRTPCAIGVRIRCRNIGRRFMGTSVG
ncbi:hypothetical protein T4B_9147 [Trichinella pseudospiralis]|uniref:Uncharacterized protein n=1 Tax=Trichinella pseudospiralis TaxID=6337 RepID=A0A0V1EVX1_TRIPS|nr:hypothetical protein T4A_7923 [Trichinella pseudospiralis]KRZ26605.1 hypothetical protein T4B_9147 [Trichinella pseudospiralis]KRZ41529.1 hypothetical protein T4C_10378 [Trichinella pseudospiralis]